MTYTCCCICGKSVLKPDSYKVEPLCDCCDERADYEVQVRDSEMLELWRMQDEQG